MPRAATMEPERGLLHIHCSKPWVFARAVMDLKVFMVAVGISTLIFSEAAIVLSLH